MFPFLPFFLTLLSLSLTTNSLFAQAKPLRSRNWSATSGAVYLITNEPGMGNSIISVGLMSDGTLQGSTITSTGGMGLVSNTAGVTPGMTHPDGLSTQDSVVVSGKSLFVCNPGSNTISMFSIDPKDPRKVTHLSTVGSGGEFPASIAVNADGTMACALNSGAVDGITCFAVDEKNGLTPIVGATIRLNLNQTTPSFGPGGTVSDLVFSNTGSLLVAVKGTSAADPGFLGEIAVSNGTIAKDIVKNVPSGGALTFSITLAPKDFGSGNFVLTTDPAVGVVTFDLSGDGVALNSTPTAVPGNIANCWSEFSKATQSFFLTDVSSSLVTEVNVDPQTLTTTIVNQTHLRNGTGPLDLGISSIKEGDFVHILGAMDQTITTMALKPDGASTVLQILQLGQLVQKQHGVRLMSSIQGMAVYVL